jgi:hypothetical protein
MKRVLRRARQDGVRTPFGPIVVHPGHRFRLMDVPSEDHAFFCVRDPVKRFVSAFNSRQRKGRPLYFFEWSPQEEEAFARYDTPNALGLALASEDPQERKAANAAMRGILHVRGIRYGLGTPGTVLAHRRRIVFIGRQESLDADWERLRKVLELPEEYALPDERLHAHGGNSSQTRELEPRAEAALRRWHRPDYDIVRTCDRLRAMRGWDGDHVLAPRSLAARTRVWSEETRVKLGQRRRSRHQVVRMTRQ